MAKKKNSPCISFLEQENIKRVCFEKIKLELTQRYRISAADLNGWNLKVHMAETDYGASYELAFNLSNFIIHGKKEIKKSIDVPVSWIDHLKLDINLWARDYLLKPKFFFTNIAKAITVLNLTPKFKKIETSIVYMRYCPHVHASDTSCHVEFLQFKNDFGEELGKLS